MSTGAIGERVAAYRRRRGISQAALAGLESLPRDFEAELVEAAERGQVSAGEARNRGSVRHVEVFQMGSVRTSIFGRPRPLPDHRRAGQHYTLKCEEPNNLAMPEVQRVSVPGIEDVAVWQY
jgi:hypothetical protein